MLNVIEITKHPSKDIDVVKPLVDKTINELTLSERLKVLLFGFPIPKKEVSFDIVRSDQTIKFTSMDILWLDGRKIKELVIGPYILVGAIFTQSRSSELYSRISEYTVVFDQLKTKA